ncbi:TonB-dependent receptor plug domain-containing protein [Bacteroides fragilis]|nr:TonB-dependent receptor plug domain-containing protein [Bacteroides fragilis]
MKIIFWGNQTLKSLMKVVVTGYGTFKNQLFTGAASTWLQKSYKITPTMAIEDKLAGSIPGVQISSFSGAPGATTSVRIRGMGSMNAGNDPLYGIDGTPGQSGNISAFNTPNTGKDIIVPVPMYWQL